MGMVMDYTARKWTDDDLWQAIEHAHDMGVQEERRRMLRAAGVLFTSPPFRARAVRGRDKQIAAALAEMDRVVREHVPNDRCLRGCAVCVARIPLVQTPDWPAIRFPAGAR